MKIFFLTRASVHTLVMVIGYMNVETINSFVFSPKCTTHNLQPVSTNILLSEAKERHSSYRNRGSLILFSSTSTKPLYDGTNYTFPDIQTTAGVAELLEVSFVHACMQLASGYVDVLKMFIASSIGSYDAGFSIASVLDELENNKDLPTTANRPLMDEEKKLRRNWLCVIYLTLSAMDYASPMSSLLAVDAAKKSIPEDIKERYGELVTRVGEAYKNCQHGTLSVEGLIGDFDKDLSPLEKAVLLQTLKVATLTPVVVEEAKEAYGSNGNDNTNERKPPTPPIEGAF